MNHETETLDFYDQTAFHRAALRTMIGESGITRLIRSLVRVCAIKAQTARSEGNSTVASEWWKLSEALNGDPLIAAMSVEMKLTKHFAPGELYDPGELKVEIQFEPNGEHDDD